MEEEYAQKPSVLNDVKDRLTAVIEAGKPVVKKIGLLKIGAAIAVLAIILALIFLVPRSGTLSLSFHELDSGNAVAGAQVSLIGSDSAVLESQYSNEAGVVVFINVPSRTTLGLEVDAGDAFKKKLDSVFIESGEEASKTVELERNLDVDLSAKSVPSTIPASCPQKLLFDAVNNGINSVEVELVGEGAFKTLVSKKTIIEPGARETIESIVSFPTGDSGQKVGSARVKFTRKSVSLSATAVNPPELSVSPEEISESVKPGEEVKKQVSFENTGRIGEVTIANADVALAGDIASIGQARFEDELSIKPGERNILYLTVNVPSSASGSLVGHLTVTTPCKTFRIPITLTVSS
ncbi:hypothetical protein H0N96_00490 [Candidatus Micrarchaeota archaeon]|nr:hypothetical protein [Candidatus Micrarchaeota archaeon]